MFIVSLPVEYNRGRRSCVVFAQVVIYIVVHTDFGVQTCVIKHVKVKK